MESAIQLHGAAARLSMATRDPKVVRMANKSMEHSIKATGAHYDGDWQAASAHLAEAVTHLQNAASLHTGTLKRGETDVSPEILDHAHLGRGQELHQEYLDEINKGKNNGR